MAEKRPRKNYCVLAGTPKSKGGDGVRFWSCHTTHQEAAERCKGYSSGIGRTGGCKVVKATGKKGRATTASRRKPKGPCVKWAKRRCLKRGKRG